MGNWNHLSEYSRCGDFYTKRHETLLVRRNTSRCAVAVPRVAFGSVANPRFLASCSE